MTYVVGVRQRKKASKRKRFVVIVVGLVLLAAVGFVVARQLLRPSEGAVVKVVPVASPAVKPTETKVIEGKHVRFTLPISYKFQPPKQADANNLEGYLFVASSIGRKLLTVTVTSLPSGQLSDDTSYQSRKLQSKIYQQKSETMQGETVTVSSSVQNDQRVAFWPHKGLLLTASLSGGSVGSEANIQEFQSILESVIWK